LPVAAWVSGALARGMTPHLFTFPSSAVALCLAASRSGIDLAGARFTLGGEPITDARLATLRAAGADVMPRYGSIECGPIAYGCLAGEYADEVPVLDDLHGLIQAGRTGAGHGLPAEALLVTSLHPRAPFTLLNVSMGDLGTLAARRCGCPLEALGWTAHLHTVRSFEKLTGAGMTFLGTDVVRVLEEALPVRFGGGPTDYQLVEDEGAEGGARLTLRVSPVLGPLDEAAVAEAFLTGLAATSPAERLMVATLREAGVLAVERSYPLPTRSGKQLHLALASRRPS